MHRSRPFFIRLANGQSPIANRYLLIDAPIAAPSVRRPAVAAATAIGFIDTDRVHHGAAVRGTVIGSTAMIRSARSAGA